jgi:hypothetical protein
MFLLIPVWWWMTKCNGDKRTQLGDVLVRIPTRSLIDWMDGDFFRVRVQIGLYRELPNQIFQFIVVDLKYVMPIRVCLFSSFVDWYKVLCIICMVMF